MAPHQPNAAAAAVVAAPLLPCVLQVQTMQKFRRGVPEKSSVYVCKNSLLKEAVKKVPGWDTLAEEGCTVSSGERAGWRGSAGSRVVVVETRSRCRGRCSRGALGCNCSVWGCSVQQLRCGYSWRPIPEAQWLWG